MQQRLAGLDGVANRLVAAPVSIGALLGDACSDAVDECLSLCKYDSKRLVN